MMAATQLATAAAVLHDGAARLQQAGIDSARLDAEVLLAFAGGWDRAALLARLRDELPDAARLRFAELLARRERREPLAYLTGEKEFWSLSFAVNPDVLVPRPETELLVEATCAHVAGLAGARVCDVGTGSGCIAVAVARTHPSARLLAIDRSPAALRVAAANAQRHGVAARVELLAGDLFAALPRTTRFDVIVSNPPYLAAAEVGAPEIAWEPRQALWAGPDGLEVIARLVDEAPSRLRPGGLLAVEIGAAQGRAALALAERAGLAAPRLREDLAGLARVLLAERSAK